ncbi:threonine-phosphate decarboxylase [Phyllobacterium leguminum]|uniref:Aminotransferase n=1 Tax=Phyllobacterium leguminum TaxID=314237 RepID=A0A318T6J0_9HYPH|nr:threonine-phosphate decarboxylase [Phyllobacterium leguminum]PYE90024.1 L-threonine O-3-phosphate decarboxylase [Phyllobacterium leguminum]
MTIERAVIEHGGALDRAIARFGGNQADWLDLSTGINPEAFPLPEITPEVWNRLPDEALLDKALAAARSYYSVADGAFIVAAPGTQALIQIVPELTQPGEVAILSPTYQEHHAAFARAGWAVLSCPDIGSIPATAKAVVVVNPNNPDGRIVPGDELLGLAQKLGAHGGFLIVDEAFADAHPEVSIAGQAGGDHLIILKSFGKFFGLAGLRLGFAISGAGIAKRLSERLGPWAVSGPALAIAVHAFCPSPLPSPREVRGEGGLDVDALSFVPGAAVEEGGGDADVSLSPSKRGEGKGEGQNVTILGAFRARLLARRALLSAVLQRSGFEEIGGTALFALVHHEQAQALYEHLCHRHILTRKFDYAPNWLRIGLADEAGLERLEEALR